MFKTSIVFLFRIVRTSPGLIAVLLTIFSTRGVNTLTPIFNLNDAASFIIPQAVAAPAISVFIVSIPEGDLSEYPPVSNKTPFPIIETLNLADLLYSPTSK